MKTIVIYHSADFDGLFCREIARKFLPDSEFIGWDYGDPIRRDDFDAWDQIYMLDISVDQLMDHPRLIWIDHHKTAIEKYPSTIPGYRIDGVAACRLAWQCFSVGPDFNKPDWLGYPDKNAFVNRTVSEPEAVRLAGEYDIWDKRDPNAELFQHGLRSMDLKHHWASLLELNKKLSITEIESLIDVGHRNILKPDGTNIPPIVHTLLENGKSIQYAKTQENESIIKSNGFTIQFEGFTLLACNAARYNSQLFTTGLKSEHDGCLGFNWDGKQWRVSLYTDKPGIDLSPVAVKYGGGGHKGACGFRTNKLPFL